MFTILRFSFIIKKRQALGRQKRTRNNNNNKITQYIHGFLAIARFTDKKKLIMKTKIETSQWAAES